MWDVTWNISLLASLKLQQNTLTIKLCKKTEWSRSINCVYSRVLPRLSTSLRMPYILIPKNQVLTNWKHFLYLIFLYIYIFFLSPLGGFHLIEKWKESRTEQVGHIPKTVEQKSCLIVSLLKTNNIRSLLLLPGFLQLWE